MALTKAQQDKVVAAQKSHIDTLITLLEKQPKSTPCTDAIKHFKDTKAALKPPVDGPADLIDTL